MSPTTLHFNVVQKQQQWSLEVDGLMGITIQSLKHQHFAEAIEAQKSVRFIMSGRLLEDAVRLDQLGLGKKAFINVSISDSATSKAKSSTISNDNFDTKGKELGQKRTFPGTNSAPIFIGAIFLVVTGVLLRLAWQRRRYLSMHVTQFLAIFASVWVYLVLFHGLPVFFRLLAGDRCSSATLSEAVLPLQSGSLGLFQRCPSDGAPNGHAGNL